MELNLRCGYDFVDLVHAQWNSQTAFFCDKCILYWAYQLGIWEVIRKEGSVHIQRQL